MGARETALNALIACRKEGAWSNGVLKGYISRDGLDRREAALASRLCYGVLQNRMKLDFYLKQLLTGRIKDLQPIVRDVLHLGLYQIYEMDKIPPSAAVNESVTLVKKYCPHQQKASGLVNGVLRNAVRTNGTLRQPETLWDTYSHPKLLVEKLASYVGKKKIEALLKANNEIVPTVAQVNTLRTTTEELINTLTGEGISAKPHKWMPDCLVLEGTGNLEQSVSFQKGLFYVQDAASKLSVLCAEIPKGSRVLDCCAAPGGKSFAAAMCGAGQIHSCDIYPHKKALIENGAERLGISNLSAYVQDAAERNPDWESQMDVVIADVPCSGYGIIRKKPDIRYKSLEEMAELPKLQMQILTRQASCVKPGGVLMYSTCTLVYEENEGLVKAFLQEHPEFSVEPLPLPPVFPENKTGMLHLIPGEYDTDGFFICRMRRAL